MRTEPEIIQCISRRLGATSRRSAAAANPKWLRVGLGDDAAVLGLGEMAGHRQRSAQELALSCDSFLEGIHFLPELHSPQAIGYKALARATSDLAAMGVRPRFFLLMLSLPPDRTGPWLDQFIAGMRKAATECKMTLIGGDTSAYSRIAVGLTVGGYVRTGHALTRSGARPGDQIFVSGTLGSAQFGFECYSAKKRISRNAPAEEYVERHLHPRIRLALGQWLAGETHQCAKIASAAIDTSDGLSTDLGHICEESGVAAMIYSGQAAQGFDFARRRCDTRWQKIRRSGARAERWRRLRVALHRPRRNRQANTATSSRCAAHPDRRDHCPASPG